MRAVFGKNEMSKERQRIRMIESTYASGLDEEEVDESPDQEDEHQVHNEVLPLQQFEKDWIHVSVKMSSE